MAGAGAVQVGGSGRLLRLGTLCWDLHGPGLSEEGPELGAPPGPGAGREGTAAAAWSGEERGDCSSAVLSLTSLILKGCSQVKKCESVSHSVMPGSLPPHGL